jgi:hypothetical protein
LKSANAMQILFLPEVSFNTESLPPVANIVDGDVNFPARRT